MYIDNHFRWIRNDIIIDFDLPKILRNTIEEAEELDRAGNIEYSAVADMIDVLGKECCRAGQITKDQWNQLCRKYPIV